MFLKSNPMFLHYSGPAATHGDRPSRTDLSEDVRQDNVLYIALQPDLVYRVV
jgi:hypothetical protein